jgi:hypothetical protein
MRRLLSLIGTILRTALLAWTFVPKAVNVLRGVEAPVVIFSSLIYAFGCLTPDGLSFALHTPVQDWIGCPVEGVRRLEWAPGMVCFVELFPRPCKERKDGALVRVVPAEIKSNAWPQASRRLQDRQAHRHRRAASRGRIYYPYFGCSRSRDVGRRNINL